MKSHKTIRIECLHTRGHQDGAPHCSLCANIPLCTATEIGDGAYAERCPEFHAAK